MAALKVGGTQKTLTSVEACVAPSIMLPAGAPTSKTVAAVLCLNAPSSRCSQSGHAASVQSAFAVHGLSVCGSHVPVPIPVQQENGTPAPVHPVHVPVPP